MYSDSKKQWNVCIGCKFDCLYCSKSFQKTMKRQRHNCRYINQELGESKCYLYEPHFHYERLFDSLPRTSGDQFIWVNSSSDIYFSEELWINIILERVKKLQAKTFFFQSKAPECFNKYDFPQNTVLGITLETNRDKEYFKVPEEFKKKGYDLISKAPLPIKRFKDFLEIEHERKRITIEPILDFDLEEFFDLIKQINPEKIYLGFDTKKCNLNNPGTEKTKAFIQKIQTELRNIKLKLKYIPYLIQ